MNDKSQIVKSLEEFDLFTKDLAKQLKIKQKNNKAYFSVCY